MAKAIEIGVGVDSKAAKQGIEAGLIEPLEDAQEALADLGKDRGPERLERNLEGAQDATERLEKDTRDTADAIEREYKKAYAKLKQDSERGYGGAEDAAAEFKAEATQNFAETASSFDGSMDSILDMAQSTFGGLASGFTGPLAAAAGGLALAGGAAFSRIIENAERMKEQVSAHFSSMVENGIAELDALQIASEAQRIIDEQFEELKRGSELTGIPISEMAETLARGGTEAQQMADAIWEMRGTLDVMSPKFVELEQLAFKFAAAREATDLAKEKYEEYAATAERIALRDSQQHVAAREGWDTRGKALQAYSDKLKNLPKEVTTEVKLDTRHLDRELARPRSINVRINPLDQYGRRVY